MTNIISLDERRPGNNNYYTTPWEHNFAWLTPETASDTDRMTICQSMLLQPMLVTWDIDISAIELLEEMQEFKVSIWDIFDRRLGSIPLSQIAPGSQVEDVVRTLTRIGAKNTIFERYAWSNRRNQGNTSQLSTIL